MLGGRITKLALFISTLTLFGPGALKSNQNTAAASTSDPPAIVTPDACSVPLPIAPLITLPSGETVQCPLSGAQLSASSSPQLPPPCPVPGVNDWCPAWNSQPYDGPGHKTDSPGNTLSRNVMGTSSDGKLVFVASTSDQEPTAGVTNYQAVTIAYDTGTGNIVWTAPYTAPAGLQSYSQSLAVGGSRVFVLIDQSKTGQYETVLMAYDQKSGAALWPAPAKYAEGTGSAEVIAASPDGARVYAGGIVGVKLADGSVRVDATTIAYDGATGNQLWSAAVQGPAGSPPPGFASSFGVATAANKVFMAAAQLNPQGYIGELDLLVVDAATGATIVSGKRANIHGDDQCGFAVSADGSRAFMEFQDLPIDQSGTQHVVTGVAAFDAKTGQSLWLSDYYGPNPDAVFASGSIPWMWGPIAANADGSRVFAATQSTDGNFGATGTGFTTIAYDGATGNELWVSEYNTDMPFQFIFVGPMVAVDPGGRQVYVVGPSYEAETYAAFTLDINTGARLKSAIYTNGLSTSNALAVSPDGARVFVGAAGASSINTTTHSTNADIVAVSYNTNLPGLPGPTPTATPTMIGSTYLGGGGGPGDYDITWATATDANGNVYIAGDSDVADFPVTANAFQKIYGNGGQDGFISKFDKNGNLLWSTYLGGSGWDGVYSLAVDANGNAVVTGVTESSDFPITDNAVQKTVTGDAAFVTVISADGTHVLYSTFLGGTISDGGVPLPVNLFHLNPNANVETIGVGIAVGQDGTLYVVGETNTIDMPITQNAAQSVIGGEFDGFIARIDTTKAGSVGLIYSTYLGGATGDFCAAVAVDPTGNAFVTGETQSANFPTTLGAYQRVYSLGTAAFITKLNPTGTSLIYSTLLSGSKGSSASAGTNYNAPSAIAIDANGNAFVAGETNATDFPTTPGVVQPANAGIDDGFITELSADGGSLVFSTYLGGSDYDGLFGLKLDNFGNIFVGGYSASHDLPLVLPFQSKFGGYYDGWVAELSPGGTALLMSSYLGGNDQDSVYGLDLWNNQLCVGGRTASTDFPVTSNAPQKTYGGGVWDNFLTIINLNPGPVQLLSAASRKIHGAAGAFDVDLTSGNGVECRSGGSNGDYTVVFRFGNPLTSVAGASVTSGTGSVVNANIDSNDNHNYIVNVTGVTNAQTIAVSLSNVSDSVGNFSSAVSASMGVLLGDVNGNRLVNSTDASLTQAQSGQPVTSSSFRMDINANGLITSTDASIVQSHSGTGLP